MEDRLSLTSHTRRCALLSVAILLGAAPARAENPSKIECVAANEAGQVLVQSGKLIEAERKLATCMAASCPIPVREDCAQRLIEVGRAIPSIVFEVKDAAGNGLRLARVTMDGQPSPDALAGKAVRLDPGQHRFSFETDGTSSVEKTFTLREGEQGRKETIVFSAPPVATAGAAPADVADRPQGQRSPLDEHSTTRARTPPLSTIPRLAYVAAGAGIAGLALGIGAGLAASSRNAALESECPGHVCTAAAQPDIDAFHTWRDWSTAGYVLAGVGLAGGVVLWLAAPRRSTSTTTAQLWLGPRGAGVAGSF